MLLGKGRKVHPGFGLPVVSTAASAVFGMHPPCRSGGGRRLNIASYHACTDHHACQIRIVVWRMLNLHWLLMSRLALALRLMGRCLIVAARPGFSVPHAQGDPVAGARGVPGPAGAKISPSAFPRIVHAPP